MNLGRSIRSLHVCRSIIKEKCLFKEKFGSIFLLILLFEETLKKIKNIRNFCLNKDSHRSRDNFRVFEKK